MQITIIFTEFSTALNASVGVQSITILVFVSSYAAHPQDTSFLRNINVAYYPPNCSSVLQPLDLGIIKCITGSI
jgi:hypothetical protein